MAYKCTVECDGCGHESGIRELPNSEFDVDEFSIGDTVKSVCLGECEDVVQEHTVVSIDE